MGCWRSILGKESKCEILKYLEPTAGKFNNQYLFYCSRWLTEGGQTRSGSQRIKMCEMSKWLTWKSGGFRNEKQGVKDSQGEGMMQRRIKYETTYAHMSQKTIYYFGSFHNHNTVKTPPYLSPMF